MIITRCTRRDQYGCQNAQRPEIGNNRTARNGTRLNGRDTPEHEDLQQLLGEHLADMYATSRRKASLPLIPPRWPDSGSVSGPPGRTHGCWAARRSSTWRPATLRASRCAPRMKLAGAALPRRCSSTFWRRPGADARCRRRAPVGALLRRRSAALDSSCPARCRIPVSIPASRAAETLLRWTPVSGTNRCGRTARAWRKWGETSERRVTASECSAAYSSASAAPTEWPTRCIPFRPPITASSQRCQSSGVPELAPSPGKSAARPSTRASVSDHVRAR
ncbi:hypothetical protein ABIB51_003983 [Arthrobacter sp. UYCu712]